VEVKFEELMLSAPSLQETVVKEQQVQLEFYSRVAKIMNQ
jgi:hypothetical protein